jgi:hypothetical protein
MLITTMNDIPGYEIEAVFGEVLGLTRPLMKPGPADWGPASSRCSAGSSRE